MPPVDRLIQRLSANPSVTATAADTATILQHLTQAPFSSLQKRADQWDLQSAGTHNPVVGQVDPASKLVIRPSTQLSNLDVHVLWRIEDGDWRVNTNPQQYLADIHRLCGAVLKDPKVQIVTGVFGNRNDPMVGFVYGVKPDGAPCTSMVSVGPKVARDVLVVYNGRFGSFSTAHCRPAGRRSPFAAWNNTRILPR